MFICLAKLEGEGQTSRYLVLDTEDNTVESLEDGFLYDALRMGFKIEGMRLSTNGTSFITNAERVSADYSSNTAVADEKYSWKILKDKVCYAIGYRGADDRWSMNYACAFCYDMTTGRYYTLMDTISERWDSIEVDVHLLGTDTIEFYFMKWNKHYYQEDSGATLVRTMKLRLNNGFWVKNELSPDWKVLRR